MATKAMVITSGGMDSTAAVFWAADTYGGFDKIETITFDYGQRHRKEIEHAKRISAMYDVRHHSVPITFLGDLIEGSALTQDDVEVPEGHYADDNMSVTVVPNRNAMMINIAATRAISIGADLVVGVHAGDHTVYPDCRIEFIESVTESIRVGNEGIGDPEFNVVAPFVFISKADIIRLVPYAPYNLTWTCYKGGEKHCGRCATCVERLEAFYLAGHVDPVEYEDEEYWKQVVDFEVEDGN